MWNAGYVSKAGLEAIEAKPMTIQVRIKNVYGNEMVYPACEKASSFAQMLGQKTLTSHAIKHIKTLGYTVEVIQDRVTL